MRMIVDVAGLVLGTIAAVITARWLGPSGKGIAATLAFLSMILTRVSVLGLGESGIVMVGREAVTPSEALRANLGAALLLGAMAAPLCLMAGVLLIHPDTGSLWLAVAVTVISIPVGAAAQIIAGALVMQQRIVEASLAVGMTSAAIVAGLIVFVIALPLGILGATLASLTGVTAGLLFAIARLRGALPVWPGWNRGYLRWAVPYGLRLEASNLVGLMSARFDLLLVLPLASASAAGNYSVALTIAGVVGLAPFAFSYAAFPRLAYASEDEASELALRVWRGGLLAGLAVAVLLGAASPLLVPFLFGEDFTAAVEPTLILLPGGVFAAGQWMLARPLAARGDASLLLASFGLSLVIMVLLDLILIPSFGTIGAALASATSNLAGLILCIRRYHRTGTTVADLTPRWPDCLALARTARSLLLEGSRRLREASHR